MILIGLYGSIYEITNFISKHPGEGICNRYLKNYKNRDITKEFERYHFTNEPFDIMIKAKEYGVYNNIYYVCNNFFRIKFPNILYLIKKIIIIII